MNRNRTAVPHDSPPAPSNQRDGGLAATDGELLMRFVHHRDEGAFALVVERHGRLVWMICRQVLRSHQDAEDAFQATFLILARRAETIRASDSAGAWLFKVAQRTALAARRKLAGRREEPLAADPPQGEEALPMIHDRQMMYALLDELRSLPERYQTPLVLRYLEGQSRRAIADETDSTVGQIQGRLARGRRMLRSRLVRRGVSLSLAAGAVTSASSTSAAGLTADLIANTAQNCFEFHTAGAAGNASSAALELANEGVRTMGATIMAKVIAVLGAIFIAVGIAWGAQPGGDGAGRAAAGRGAAEVVLDALATDTAATAEEPRIALVLDDDQGTEAARRDVASKPEKLKQIIAAMSAELEKKASDRSKRRAELEMAELEKSLLRRELEAIHGFLLQVKQEAIFHASGPDDEQQALEGRVEQVFEKFTAAKDALERQTLRVADISAELEARERERTISQQRLENLEHLLMQLDVRRELSEAADGNDPGEADASAAEREARAAPRLFSGQGPAPLEGFQAEIGRQLEQLHREMAQLHAENMELHKLLEQVRAQRAAGPSQLLP